MKKYICLFSILMLFAAEAVFAQNVQDLRVGASVSGNINNGQEFWYRVRSTENCILTVETFGSTDTYLEVYDSQQRNLLMENDDGPNEYNARVEIFAMAGDIYMFKLRGYDSDTSGPFRISATQKNIPRTPELPINIITLETRSGNIDRNGEYWFTVKPAVTGTLVVETSGDTDTFLTAYGENGFFVEDDDGGWENNARISINVQKPGTTYLFKLRGYDSDVRGPYKISASIIRN